MRWTALGLVTVCSIISHVVAVSWLGVGPHNSLVSNFWIFVGAAVALVIHWALTLGRDE